MMTLLDLFSGIGAFSLGLERSGAFRTVAFCELDPFCRRVLAKHWPEVPCYDDVRSLTADRLRAAGISVDVICGGFPCQDISIAGRGAGIGGERSGLWSEYARLVGELRPRYVLVENVSALLGRGLGVVLGDLSALGYDAEWHCIPAAAVGAPHIRDRVWIVADTDSRRRGRQRQQEHAGQPRASWDQPDGRGEGGRRHGSPVADADGRGWREQGDVGEAPRDARPGQSGHCGEVALPRCPRLAIGAGTLREWAHATTTGAGWWAAEPAICRVVTRAADRVDRRKRLIGLGNSLVPQIPELIGRAILAREASAQAVAA